MKTKLIKLALSFFSSDDGRKFVRNEAVVIISPFVAITVLIGAIFSDGISFNHNLVTDLFEGNPISELTGEMKQYVQEIQDGLVLIDSHIDKINQTFTNGSSLNIYQVKGYFIGYMVSSQHKVYSGLYPNNAQMWFSIGSMAGGEAQKVAILSEDVKLKHFPSGLGKLLTCLFELFDIWGQKEMNCLK